MLFALTRERIRSEVWVDGSFLTNKIEPDDVDVVVVLRANDVPTTESGWVVLERVVSKDFSSTVGCDSYLHIDLPETDPRYLENEVMRSYWIKQFCFNRTEDMKGLAVIETPVV